MSVLAANCPSCGAPVEFKSGSTIVLICPYCRSALARTDRGINDLGKVAEIAASESPLKIGLRGTYLGHGFELTGRAQLKHQQGGFWDEWYATFSNGWVGWLAEAQGRFYMTFFKPLPDGAAVPGFGEIRPGQMLENIGAGDVLVVQEKGVATAVAAEGEIPYRLVPGEQSPYADLAGKGGVFATIDYGASPPWLFLGRQVTLADIGLADARPAEREARRVEAAAMSCPNCGGPLDLIAPDKAERVTCPNCNSLLDVNQGNLVFFKALQPPPSPPGFVLTVGAEGTLRGSQFKICGAMVRSVTIDGATYYWHEYLLYNPAIGYRWLIHSDNHWSFAEPVNPADVVDSGFYGRGATIFFGGRKYKIFQDAVATVRYVTGEFYWRVEQGESVRAVDFISPPEMLSKEQTADEINWSLARYVPIGEIEKAFGVSNLQKPWGVAPNQPFTGSFYYTYGAIPLLLLVVFAIFLLPFTGITNTVLSQDIVLPPLVSESQPQTAFSQPFELKANRNVRITASAPVNNSWADLDIDLINEQSQEIESVNIPIEFYYGSDSDGQWTEGSRTSDAPLSSLPGGKYTLRVEGTWQAWQAPMPVSVKVEQNVNRGVNFVCAFLLLAIVPFLGLVRKISFEGARWKESMFGSVAESGSDDDD